MKTGGIMLVGVVAITIGMRLLSGSPPSSVPGPTAPPEYSTEASRPLRSETASLVLARVTGTPVLDERITALQRRIAGGDERPATFERLGWAFVAKARASNDAGFYRIAEACAAAVEEHSGGDRGMRVGALLLRGHVLQNLHRFAEAETAARDALALRRTSHGYALLGDALLDQGRLADAVTAYEQMMQLRPDAQAFARAAEVRFLTGDVSGATAAMNMAISASGAGDAESRAWMHTRRAWYALHDGRLDAAREDAARAVALHAELPAAHTVLGRIDLARGDFTSAVRALAVAAELSPSVEGFWLLAEACRGASDDACAGRADAEARRRLGPNDRRASASFLAETGGDADLAVALAADELTRRQDAYTLDAMALAQEAAGDCRAARTTIDRVLGTGIRDGRLFLHAGLIAASCGDAVEASRQLTQATAHEHVLTPSQRQRLRRVLQDTQNQPQYRIARRTP